MQNYIFDIPPTLGYNTLIKQIINQKVSEMNMHTKINTSNDVRAAKGQFMIGGFSDDSGMSFAAHPTLQRTAVEARRECLRLSKLNPGKVFVYVQVCGGEFTPIQPQTTSF